MAFTQSLLYQIVIVALFVLGFFVTFIYASNNFKLGTTQKIISLLLVLLNFRIFLTHLYLTRDLLEYPHLMLVSNLLSRIAVPLLFLLVFYEVVRPQWKWYDIFHFLPVVFFLFIFKDIYFGTTAEKQQLLAKMYQYGYDSVWTEGNWFNQEVIFWIRTGPILIYIATIILLLLLGNNFREISNTLRHFFIAVLLYMIINLSPLVINLLGLPPDEAALYVHFIGFLATMVILIYFFFIPNFLYARYFFEKQQYHETGQESQINAVEVAELKALFECLKNHLEQTQSYLNPEFNLKKLADALEISERHISAAIKVETQLNFSQYINDLRIKYLLENFTVESIKEKKLNQIAYEIGFNSLSSFYSVFKHKLGSTPQEYFKEK